MASGTVLYNIGYQLTLKFNNDRRSDIFNFDRFPKCRWKTTEAIHLAYYFSGALLVPLHEFVFYPLLQTTYPVYEAITGNSQWA